MSLRLGLGAVDANSCQPMMYNRYCITKRKTKVQVVGKHTYTSTLRRMPFPRSDELRKARLYMSIKERQGNKEQKEGQTHLHDGHDGGHLERCGHRGHEVLLGINAPVQLAVVELLTDGRGRVWDETLQRPNGIRSSMSTIAYPFGGELWDFL
jgi:hypothetical protein